MSSGPYMGTVYATEEDRRLNGAMLAACARPHRFVCVDDRDDSGRRARYQCKTCQGVIGEVAHSWYVRGVADGQRIERQRPGSGRTPG